MEKGAQIKCSNCHVNILITARAIPACSPIKSVDFTYIDGAPLPFRALLKCPLCGDMFKSINTTIACTVGWYD